MPLPIVEKNVLNAITVRHEPKKNINFLYFETVVNRMPNTLALIFSGKP